MSTREASAGKSITVSEIAITGVCIALTFVATGFINIRLPIAANGGLVHLGNVPLFLAAIIFGKRTGALAGSFGMALFDLMGGWVLWAPFTFVIVGLMGFTVGAITTVTGWLRRPPFRVTWYRLVWQQFWYFRLQRWSEEPFADNRRVWHGGSRWLLPCMQLHENGG